MSSLVGFSTPVFYSAIMFIVLFAAKWSLLPVGGIEDVRYEGNWVGETIDLLQHLILPALSLGIIYLWVSTPGWPELRCSRFWSLTTSALPERRAPESESLSTNTPFGTPSFPWSPPPDSRSETYCPVPYSLKSCLPGLESEGWQSTQSSGVTVRRCSAS
ncbi:MAG: hypothetical protein Ct9H300mP12_15880 [Acidimicrobiales bacterium]|nr:MAG: hypothetical protein Ct9H300mP12_15880 [Acidimicrobiales bacterium]